MQFASHTTIQVTQDPEKLRKEELKMALSNWIRIRHRNESNPSPPDPPAEGHNAKGRGTKEDDDFARSRRTRSDPPRASYLSIGANTTTKKNATRTMISLFLLLSFIAVSFNILSSASSSLIFVHQETTVHVYAWPSNNNNNKETATTSIIRKTRPQSSSNNFTSMRVDNKDSNNPFEHNKQWQEVKKKSTITTESSQATSTSTSTSSSSSVIFPPTRHIQYLPPLEWEYPASNCEHNRPKHIPDTCCIGSTSKGGEIVFKHKWAGNCKIMKNSTVYEAEQISLNYLQEQTKQCVLDESQTSTTRCDLCWIMDYLLSTNQTLTFIGDSIMAQTFNAFMCELYRRGYFVNVKEASRQQWKDPSWGFKYGIDYDVNITVWERDPKFSVAAAEPRKSAYIRFHRAYKPYLKSNQLEDVAKYSNFIVFDHSLHYMAHDSRSYKEEMSAVITKYLFSSESQVKLLFYRETIAQHFNNTAGGGDFISHADLERQCIPLQHNRTENYRTQWIRDAAINATGRTITELFKGKSTASKTSVPPKTALPLKPKDFVFLPFYDLTRRLLLLKGNECTHPCHIPGMWIPTFRNLRIAMDQLEISSSRSLYSKTS